MSNFDIEKIEKNMIKSRLKEIQNEISSKRDRIWKEYNELQKRIREEEEELIKEWEYLNNKLKSMGE